MRTFFHKDTGKYLGNVADDRKPDDPTLPRSHQGQIAVEGEWNGEYRLNLGKMAVEKLPPPQPLTKADRIQAALAGNEIALAMIRREAKTRSITVATVLQELAGELA